MPIEQVMEQMLRTMDALGQIEGDEPPGQEHLPLLMAAAEGTIRLLDEYLAAARGVLAQIAEARHGLHDRLVAVAELSC